MIIGLTGYKRSGKTEVGRILMQGDGADPDYVFHRRPFARVLKEMLKTAGLVDEQIDGEWKEKPCYLLGGKTPRWAMQTLGTEWGRKLIHQDLWVMLWLANTRALLKAFPWQSILADDVRFPNEVDAIHDLGGMVWRISRPGCVADGHESESHIENLKVDWEIKNDGSLDWLRLSVEHALEAMKERAKIKGAMQEARLA